MTISPSRSDKSHRHDTARSRGDLAHRLIGPRVAAYKFIVREEVRDALDQWLDAVAAGDSKRVLKLYTDDAVLLPTMAGEVHDTPALRKRYFDNFTARKNLRGELVGRPNIKISGKMAVAAGLYEFSFTSNGVVQRVPARYSFVFRETREGLRIVHHHSSGLPHP